MGAKIEGCMFDEEGVLRALSAWCKAKGVTTDAQLSTAIDGLTDAQVLALTRAFFKQFIAVRINVAS